MFVCAHVTVEARGHPPGSFFSNTIHPIFLRQFSRWPCRQGLEVHVPMPSNFPWVLGSNYDTHTCQQVPYCLSYLSVPSLTFSMQFLNSGYEHGANTFHPSTWEAKSE